MATSSSIYERLDTSKSEIRLLEIIHDDGEGATVRCRMRTSSLDEKPFYCALSYVWGDAKVTKDMTINDQVIAVTVNLEAALRCLRKKQAIRSVSHLFWADAVCINQANLKERASQVQLMRRIYSDAQVVISWVSGGDYKLAHDTIHTIATEHHRLATESAETFANLTWILRHPFLCEPTKQGPDHLAITNAWKALSLFFNDEYWNRAWVFQEMVLANRFYILLRDGSEVEDNVLYLIVRSLREVRESIKVGLVTKPLELGLQIWSDVRIAMRELEEICAMFNMRQLLRTSKWPIEQLGAFVHSKMRVLKATNSKDHIYALLGVTRLPIVPEYDDDIKSVAELYCEYTACLIERHRGVRPNLVLSPLGFLSKSGFGLHGRKDKFPTWVPNYPKEAAGGTSSMRVYRSSPKNLALFAEERNHFPRVDVGTRSLHAWGVRVGIVSRVHAPKILDDHNLFEIACNLYQRVKILPVPGHAPLEAIFRLFTRDLELETNERSVIRALAFLKYLVISSKRLYPGSKWRNLTELGLDISSPAWNFRFMKSFFPDHDITSLKLPSNPGSILAQETEGPIGSVAFDLESTLAAINDSWRYIETQDGYIGLAPEGVAYGDQLYMLEHSLVPVGLRTVPNEQYFELLGTCFILGMMNGELRTFLSSAEARPASIEIR